MPRTDERPCFALEGKGQKQELEIDAWERRLLLPPLALKQDSREAIRTSYKGNDKMEAV